MKHKLILIFTLCTMFSCHNNGTISESDKESKLRDVKELADKIGRDFQRIGSKVSDLALFVHQLYRDQDSYRCSNPGIYAISDKGVLYKTRNDGNAAVFVSGVVPVDEHIRKIVCFTEPLDTAMKALAEKNPEIVQVYYNDRNSYNRIYPFFDVLVQYEPKMNIPEFNFYYLADQKHNPEKKETWVKEPYVDPAGRGWMVSAIAPVYYKDELVGVPGLDITISTITDRYLKDQNEDIIIVDNTGVIVAADEKIISILNLPPLKAHKYLETIKQDTYKKDEFNMLKNKDKTLRAAFNNVLSHNTDVQVMDVEGVQLAIFAAEIEVLDWYVIKIQKLN